MRKHLGTLLILFAVVMQFESEGNPKIPLGKFSSEVWVTAYPIPYFSKQLILEEP